MRLSAALSLLGHLQELGHSPGSQAKSFVDPLDIVPGPPGVRRPQVENHGSRGHRYRAVSEQSRCVKTPSQTTDNSVMNKPYSEPLLPDALSTLGLAWHGDLTWTKGTLLPPGHPTVFQQLNK